MRTSFRTQSSFTLVEMLAAIAILAILVLVLANLLSDSAALWIRGQSQNDYRTRARAALDYIGRDLELAVLAANQPALTAVTVKQPTLEFLTDPAGVTSYSDSFFWQAPIATDNYSSGNLAEVGYFVRWINGRGSLCRFFVNPSDTANYEIYGVSQGQWISQSLLNTVAPGTSASLYRGFFLSDIVGLWIQVYPALTTATPSALAKPYDSSSPSDINHPLPAYAIISIATLDAPTAIQVQQTYNSGSAPPTPFVALYTSSTNAQQFAAALNQNVPVVHQGARDFSLTVHFANYHTFPSP